jgi:hypothetical protein
MQDTLYIFHQTFISKEIYERYMDYQKPFIEYDEKVLGVNKEGRTTFFTPLKRMLFRFGLRHRSYRREAKKLKDKFPATLNELGWLD